MKARWPLKLISVVVCLASCTSTPQPLPKTTTLTFAPSQQPILNPERGFFVPMDLIGTTEFGGVRAAGYTLTRTYVRLDAYREQDLSQSLLDDLDKSLAGVRAAGIKVILRFSYNFGPYPNSEPDASKPQMIRHIEQLKPMLTKNADVIAWMEAGFIGAWGEWHTSTNGLDKSLDDKRDVLTALLSALPANRMVQLRYPTDIIQLLGDAPTEAEAFNQGDMSRVGHHNDCFLASDDDWGTYNRDGQNTRESDQKYLSQLSRFTPTGGETCNDNPPRSNCETALKELALLHFTEINLSYHPQVARGWRKQGCFDEISNRLGYRLSLAGTSFADGVRVGDALSLNVTLANTGFASLINPRNAYVVLDGPEHIIKLLDDIDPRRWEAGQTHTFSATIPIPANAKPGTYRLALWLPDADDGLRDDPRYAVRLANDEVWDEATGFNVITNTLTIR